MVTTALLNQVVFGMDNQETVRRLQRAIISAEKSREDYCQQGIQSVTPHSLGIFIQNVERIDRAGFDRKFSEVAAKNKTRVIDPLDVSSSLLMAYSSTKEAVELLIEELNGSSK